MIGNLHDSSNGLNLRADAPIKIPLCAGLTIVTAISQQTGDYESIKTILSVTDQEVRLKYSSEHMESDLLSNEKPKLKQTTTFRTIRVEDLANANLYEQQFYEKLPELIVGTTAVGTSAAVLNALKTKGEAEIGIFIAFTGEPSLDLNVHPNVFDNQMVAKIRRVEPVPVMLPLIVNNQRVQLPAIHAAGDFFGDKTEFFFLDDPANPIALKWRYGIDALDEVDAETAKMLGGNPSRDRDSLQVTKITYHCDGTQLGSQQNSGGGGATSAASGSNSDSDQLEKSLATTGNADVYDIYFTFNSDEIREESEPRLKEIANVLAHHPEWKLNVRGHTDSIGGDSFNLDLSRRRAAAVKNALVARYHIAALRLTTAGFGKSRPRDTNETLEGRARNRRVELVRQ
jgi:outer membrane protein OmpA-like peptidoglycan-associated protein